MVALFEPTKQDRKTYEDMSVVILTPCGGYQSAFRFVKSAVNMVAYSWLHGLKIYQMGGSERMVVHWARNDLAGAVKGKINEYTGKPFTHILWLDDDHVFNLRSFHGIAGSEAGANSWAEEEAESIPLRLESYYQVPFEQYQWMAKWCPWLLRFCADHLRGFIWEQRFEFVKIGG